MNSTETNVLALLDSVRAVLRKRGSRTITGLGRTFRALDSYDGNKKVDAGEFQVGLSENGVDLTNKQADLLFAFFDKNGDGCVDFDEFLVAIRGNLHGPRLEIVGRAFSTFDRDGSGNITVEDLADVYSVEMHPKYQNGELSKEEIFEGFLESFGDKNKDGVITKEEWVEYYSAVSSNIDNDDHFVLLMKNAWGLE
mmetsp:Transcript_8642/g.7665  ORF Transcript_8642/g.7665 Transcript_8642/m.7665 type:complete len:196 (-) Transcript_8642:86-673(-)